MNDEDKGVWKFLKQKPSINWEHNNIKFTYVSFKRYSKFFFFGLVLEVQDRIFFLARPLLTVERKLRNYLMCEKAETRINQDKLVRRPVVLVSERNRRAWFVWDSSPDVRDVTKL